jgi:FeS assembly SUF system protein
MPEHISAALREITEEEDVAPATEEPAVSVEESDTAAAPNAAFAAEEEEEVYDGEPVAPEEAARIETEVIEAIKTVFDPEIPVNIYELGLIYDVDVHPGSVVAVRMTLTSPNCPAAQTLPEEVKQKSASVDGVEEARVKVVWDPPWGPQMMSEAAQLELNLM